MEYRHVAMVKGRAEFVNSKSLVDARREVIRWAIHRAKGYKWKNDRDFEDIRTPTRKVGEYLVSDTVGTIHWVLKDGKFKFYWETQDHEKRTVRYVVYPNGVLDAKSKFIYKTKKLHKSQRYIYGRRTVYANAKR